MTGLDLSPHDKLFVRQIREYAEWIGFETRNKYLVHDELGGTVAFAAEQQKGIFGFLMRQWVGHWRSFEIHIFDSKRALALVAFHPFRFFFQRLEIFSPERALRGAIQQRFSFFHKCFDVEDAEGRVLMRVESPFWRMWTFPFTKQGSEVASVRKKWTGIISEAFTDRDNFLVEFRGLDGEEKRLVLAAALFIDLRYFERKAGR